VRPIVPRALVRWAAGPMVNGIASTWRIEEYHPERWQEARSASGPRIFMLWHETLLPLLWHHRRQGASIVVSRARDGQYLVDYARQLGYETIEGSSHRGRMLAMRGSLRALQAGALLAITPDGPRGPRREIKPGGLAAAQVTGATVFTAFAAARPARRLRSWDRMLIPAPFARVRVGYGPPFTVGPGETAIQDAVARTARELAMLEQEIEWPGATHTA
jgi:lysophospholipid acyltransferase (LPLAT)-like uncharacterized protein